MFVCYIKTCACLVLRNQVLNPLPFLALFVLLCIHFVLPIGLHFILHFSNTYCLFFSLQCFIENIGSKWMGKVTNRVLHRADLDECPKLLPGQGIDSF